MDKKHAGMAWTQPYGGHHMKRNASDRENVNQIIPHWL